MEAATIQILIGDQTIREQSFLVELGADVTSEQGKRAFMQNTIDGLTYVNQVTNECLTELIDANKSGEQTMKQLNGADLQKRQKVSEDAQTAIPQQLSEEQSMVE